MMNGKLLDAEPDESTLSQESVISSWDKLPSANPDDEVGHGLGQASQIM